MDCISESFLRMFMKRERKVTKLPVFFSCFLK